MEAINTLIALCRLQKVRRPRRPNPSALDIRLKQDVKPLSVLDPPDLSDSIPIKCKATQCIFCLGKERLPVVTYLKSFYSRGDLEKHFHCKHLQHHSNSKLMACPYPRYNVELRGKMHLQNHIALMHKILT